MTGHYSRVFERSDLLSRAVDALTEHWSFLRPIAHGSFTARQASSVGTSSSGFWRIREHEQQNDIPAVAKQMTTVGIRAVDYSIPECLYSTHLLPSKVLVRIGTSPYSLLIMYLPAETSARVSATVQRRDHFGLVDFGVSRPLSDHIDLEPFNASRVPYGFLVGCVLKSEKYTVT